MLSFDKFKCFRENYVKTIQNEGMPNMIDPTQRGNIYIKFDIIYPLYLPFTEERYCEIFKDN